MDFERKIEKKNKTRKNSYTRPLYITDPKYGPRDHEIRSFCQFLTQIGDFL
jgi:hypothetical protein